MADLRDYTKKNPIFTGTDGIRLPTGNNAQRVASSNVAGTLRYNTDISGMEFYSSTGWVPVASPPSISTVTPSTYSGESGTEFTIDGSNFAPDVQVYFITSNGTTVLASTVTYVGNSQLKATTPRAITVQEEPISVRVNQSSGVSTKVDCIDAGGLPNWITTAGTLGSIFGANTVNVYVSATDPEGTVITYQISSGSLPGGLNFSTANGLIQGVANSVLANTTYNFTIKANDTVNNNTDRTFSYTVLNRAPVINTAAGSLGTIYSGNAASASISAYDPDGGSITYSVSSGTLPVNSSLGSANGVITGTPVVVTTNTIYTFTITSTDEGSLTASNNYTYTVLNRPPLWNTDPTLSSYSAETFTPITVNAYDPDGGSITYSLTSGSVPSGLSFVTANATITGSPADVTDNTTSTFTVTATDPGADANARTFSLTITPIIDAQFSNTVLLLKTAENTVIKDNSSSNLPLTVVGDACASNFGPLNTSWSNYFGAYASGNYLTYVPGTSVAFGTGDFTVECWVYWDTDPGATANPYIIDTRGGGGAWSFSWNWNGTSSGSVLAWTKADGTNHQPTTQMPLYQWNHCAYVRSGTTGTIYLNGVSILSFTDSTNYSASISLAYLGKRYSGNQANPGYLSNLRIVKGTAVYTSAFTPPTSKLTAITNTVLLTCQDNTFKDSSTANSGTGFDIALGGSTKVTGFSPNEETDTSNGSMYFDGTGDYVTIPSATPLQLTTSTAFTIEAWINPTVLNGDNGILGKRAGAGSGIEWQFFVKSNKQIVMWNGSTDYLSGSTISGVNAWSHVAVTWDLTTLRFFINGKLCSSTHTGISLGTAGSSVVTIGGNYPNGELFTGYISNLRLVKGTAVYTSSFVPPTGPLTTIPLTSLLTLQNRQPHNNHGFIDESRNKSIVTRYGNTTQGTFTPFSADLGKWSNYFNGSTDYLTTPSNAALAYGSGDFTFEAFSYLTSNASANSRLLGNWSGTWGANFWSLHSNHSSYTGKYSFFVYNYNSGSAMLVSTSNAPLNQWVHIVITRSGNTWRLFINGALEASQTSSASIDGGSSDDMFIGGTGQAGEYSSGYLSNVRIVKGTAVYTSAFTPPTTPLTVISGTSLLTCRSNRFLDTSSNAFIITLNGTPSVQVFSPFAPNSAYSVANTGGSIYNAAIPDGLKLLTPNPIFGVSGNYTISMWFYPTGQTGEYNPLWILSDSSGSDNPMAGFFYTSSYNLFWLNDGAGGNGFNGNMGINIVPFQWNHIVVCRAGGTTRCWTNGVLRVDGWTAGSMNTSKRVLYIGTGRTNADTTPGYTSGFEFLNGTALYPTNANFTPPTLPPSVTANTAALINGTYAAIIDSTGKNVIQTVGDAKVNNSVSKFNTGSMYFDGTGDYLVSPANQFYNFGNGDFTIECWVRLITIGTAKMLVTSNYNAGTGAGGWALIHRADISSLSLSVNSNVVYSKSWSPTAGIWYHVSVSRSGTNLRFFIDGTQIGTTSTSSDNITGSSTVLVAGNSTSNLPIDANINDLRITKSARYTTTFTPPTRSFPNR
jgi:hypothetical protein